MEQVDCLSRWKVMAVTLKRNGWGADCVDASAGPLEVMESSLGLLRFRTSPKPYSDKDKRNPREAQGGAADVKAPTAAPGICLLVCKDSTWQSLSMTEIAGQLCPVFGVKSLC